MMSKKTRQDLPPGLASQAFLALIMVFNELPSRLRKEVIDTAIGYTKELKMKPHIVRQIMELGGLGTNVSMGFRQKLVLVATAIFGIAGFATMCKSSYSSRQCHTMFQTRKNETLTAFNNARMGSVMVEAANKYGRVLGRDAFNATQWAEINKELQRRKKQPPTVQEKTALYELGEEQEFVCKQMLDLEGVRKVLKNPNGTNIFQFQASPKTWKFFSHVLFFLAVVIPLVYWSRDLMKLSVDKMGPISTYAVIGTLLFTTYRGFGMIGNFYEKDIIEFQKYLRDTKMHSYVMGFLRQYVVFLTVQPPITIIATGTVVTWMTSFVRYIYTLVAEKKKDQAIQRAIENSRRLETLQTFVKKLIQHNPHDPRLALLKQQ